MTSTVENAYVAQSIETGIFFAGDLGVDLPTGPDDALDDGLKDHGTLGEDGISVGITRTSTDVKDFDGALFVDIQTEYNGTFQVVFLESSHIEVKKTMFGSANVTVTSGENGTVIHTAHNPDQLPIRSFVIQTKSGAKRKRYVIERGRVSELAEFKDASSDVTRYQATVKAFRNAAGNFVEEYETDGKPVAAG